MYALKFIALRISAINNVLWVQKQVHLSCLSSIKICFQIKDFCKFQEKKTFI